MNESPVLGIIIIAVGLFAIIASLSNWEPFFNNRRAQGVIRTFGRKGARIFYVVLGLVICATGVLAMLGIIGGSQGFEIP